MTSSNAGDPEFPRLNPPRLGELGTCPICYQPMTLIEDGQTTHPTCAPPPETSR
jgi:hypothetical protein